MSARSPSYVAGYAKSTIATGRFGSPTGGGGAAAGFAGAACPKSAVATIWRTWETAMRSASPVQSSWLSAARCVSRCTKSEYAGTAFSTEKSTPSRKTPTDSLSTSGESSEPPWSYAAGLACMRACVAVGGSSRSHPESRFLYACFRQTDDKFCSQSSLNCARSSRIVLISSHATTSFSI